MNMQMYRARVLALALFIALVAAGRGADQPIFVGPTLQSNGGDDYTTAENGYRGIQGPLIPDNDYGVSPTRRFARLAIESSLFRGIFPVYRTNIAIGTPNQAFSLTLDLAYGGAIVRSEMCPVDECGEGLKYSHSASSTYYDEHERFAIGLPLQVACGNVSRDHVQLVDLNITDVIFGAIDDIHAGSQARTDIALFGDGYRRTTLCEVFC